MTKDLTNGSPLRLIIGFAAPMLAGMLFQQFYNFVDTMIVGRFLGVNALAGVGATGSINFFFLGFCMGLCAGFAIPVAQCFGAKDEKAMREFSANAIWLSVFFAAVISVITVVFCRDILRMMNTPLECFEEAHAYISVIFAGVPFIFMYNLLSGFLRSLGDSKTPLFFLVLSSVLNVLLDLLLILVIPMGVRGAALATVISQAVSGALCLLWIYKKVPILHAKREEWRLNPKRMRMLCTYGVPMGMQYSITAIGSIILQTAVNSLGAVAVAAVAAGGKVLGFLACPFDALGSTMATYGAQNVGAKKYERLNRGVFAASWIGFVYSALAFVFVCCLGAQLVGLFAAGEQAGEMIRLARQHLVISVAFFPLLALVNIVRFMIQGMGYSLLAVVAGVLEMVARAAAGLLLVPSFGFVGAVLGSPLAWIFADIFLIPAYFRCRRLLLSRVHHMYASKA